MLKVEDRLLWLPSQMVRIMHPIKPSCCVQLAKDFISGPQAEKDMIKFKYKCCFRNDIKGKILSVRGYWDNFKKNNVHSIVSKYGRKYETDRDKWTTCRNFANMHDRAIEEMCEAGCVEKLDSPMWVNRDKKLLT